MYYSTTLEYAKAYTKKGFLVFPCHTMENGACSCGDTNCKSKAKHPLTANGVKDASNDELELNRFFTDAYAIANIAVACGEQSGIFVLDVDDNEALTKLETQYGTLPKTWSVKTGSGGRHYYFKHVDGLKNAVELNRLRVLVPTLSRESASWSSLTAGVGIEATSSRLARRTSSRTSPSPPPGPIAAA